MSVLEGGFCIRPDVFVSLVSHLLPEETHITREAVWLLHAYIEQALVEYLYVALLIVFLCRREEVCWEGCESEGGMEVSVKACDFEMARKVIHYPNDPPPPPSFPLSGLSLEELSARMEEGLRWLLRLAGVLECQATALFQAMTKCMITIIQVCLTPPPAEGLNSMDNDVDADGDPLL